MQTDLNDSYLFILLAEDSNMPNVPNINLYYFELNWGLDYIYDWISNGIGENKKNISHPLNEKNVELYLGSESIVNDKEEELISGDFELFRISGDVELKIPMEYEVELCSEGLGGTYFIKDFNGENMFVFKPEDEEPGSVNNPKKNFMQIKDGVLPGEGAMRECIAYHLDRDHFAGVPKTKYVEIENFDNSTQKKKGALQQFIKNNGNTYDYGSSIFTVENVQKIAQLDIRTFNLDRNGENLLVCENDGEYKLVPIDHSYILPTVFNKPWFEWMNWKQVKQPITSEVKKYIEEIDIEKDSLLLQQLGMTEESITIMKLSTLALKRGASVGWTLYQIANFICTPISKTDKRSEFEKLVHHAKQKNSNEFWSTFTELLYATIK